MWVLSPSCAAPPMGTIKGLHPYSGCGGAARGDWHIFRWPHPPLLKAARIRNKHTYRGTKVWALTPNQGWRAGIIAFPNDSCAQVYFTGGQKNTFAIQLDYTIMIPRERSDRLDRPKWLERPRINSEAHT